VPQQTGGGGGLLGNLLFGKQGIMGMFPQSIQQSGIVGSLVNKLGSAVTPGANAAPAGSPMQDNQPSGGILSKLFGGGAVPA